MANLRKQLVQTLVFLLIFVIGTILGAQMSHAANTNVLSIRVNVPEFGRDPWGQSKAVVQQCLAATAAKFRSMSYGKQTDRSQSDKTSLNQ